MKITKKLWKLTKKSMEKQGLKTEGSQDQFFIDFGWIFPGFGGKKLSRAPSRTGSIFRQKNGSNKTTKKWKKSKPRGYGNIWSLTFWAQVLPNGSKIHVPREPKGPIWPIWKNTGCLTRHWAKGSANYCFMFIISSSIIISIIIIIITSNSRQRRAIGSQPSF